MSKQKKHAEHVADEIQRNRNWLAGWDEPIEFKADPDDREAIREEKRDIRVYVRGWLAEHNAENNTGYIFERFEFERESESPLTYRVKAFLIPPAEEAEHDENGGHHDDDESPTGGHHLIPPPPPPPADN